MAILISYFKFILFFSLETTATVQRLTSEASGAAAAGAAESESRHLKEEIAVLHKVVAGK